MKVREWVKANYDAAGKAGGRFPVSRTLSEKDALELASELSDMNIFLSREQRTFGKHHPSEIFESMKRGEVTIHGVKVAINPLTSSPKSLHE